MGSASSPGLTDQQRRAIDTRHCSVALSAGAGCGKTHVLVERYLSHLAPGDNGPAAPLGGLIAITFTDRAAREMRDRVRRRCRQRLQKARDEVEAEAWLTLLRELETARVSTIHAFCGQLLRAHAVEAGIDPRFQIMQPGQAATLFSEQMDDQLRTLLGQRDEHVLNLAVTFGMSSLRDMLQELREHRATLDFAEWASCTPQDLVERWQATERKEVLPQVRHEFLTLPAVATIRNILAKWTPKLPKLVERFGVLREQFAALDEGADLLAALGPIRDAAIVQGAGVTHWYSEEIYGQFRDAAKVVRDWIDKMSGRIGVDERALASAAAGLALLRVADPVFAAYDQRKRELGVLDFGDLMMRARDLLQGEHGAALRRQMSSRLVLLLVDEFQDTDPLQVQLVKILCGQWLAEGKLFFVGDAKQSIYRFRGADPRVFRALREEIPPAGRLPLTENFRSQPAILDFVNALFCDRLGPEFEPLRAARQALGAEPRIEFLWATLDSDAEVKPNAEMLRRREADWIARRLAQLLAQRELLVSDKGTGQARPVETGDVAILFRALSDVRYYEEALRRYGIPYYLVGGSAFYAQQEVYDLLNLLRYLSAPHDAVSLAGVLRSPFFSLADEALFWLAQHPGGLVAGLFAEPAPAELDEASRRKVRFAATTLAELRALKDRLPIASLIREALARTGYDALLLAEFLGERKLGNLRKLIDQARGFDESGIFTLADYVHELAEFVARQPDEPAAPVELESGTVVRLMTIHQAKGLEFPFVVVPDLARSPSGSRQKVTFDPQWGPLLRVDSRGAAGPCGLDLYRLLQKQEDADEEIRLLYVATTRAADHLILAAGVKDLDKPAGAWLELLDERFSLRTGELKATLPAGFAPPQLAVTLTEPALPAGTIAAHSHVDLAATVSSAREAVAAGAGVVPEMVLPIPPDPTARRIFSFSRLAGDFEPATSASAQSSGDESATIGASAENLSSDPASDATELGTLVHAVLAQVDFARREHVTVVCQREVARRFARGTVEPGAAIELVERFLRSPRAAELRQATALHRELEFLLAWPPGGAGDGRLIQGFIDCLFQDAAGAWHVLDFKTNRVAAAAVPRAAAAYEMQMNLYALAAEEVLGVSPASLILHFLQPGVEHVLDWNAQARQRTIAQIDAALRAASGS